MKESYPAASLETAACLWEAVLDRCNDSNVNSAFERLGTSEVRSIVLRWVELVDVAWQKVEKTYDAPFDWEFVPQWISAHIDWTTERPTYRIGGL